jgi:putative transposase
MENQFDCYHVFSKSIAGYEIFRDEQDYLRLLGIFNYYRFIDPPFSYSDFIDIPFGSPLRSQYGQAEHLHVLAYCLMPTHFHLVVEQVSINGVSEYLRICLNAYTRYFNERYGRKGPLWQGRANRVSVGMGEPFLHVTRYVHLNPVTAYIVEDPKDWPYSSYHRYIGCPHSGPDLMVCMDYLNMSAKLYCDFVVGYKEEQRNVAKFKKMFLD